MIPSDEDTIAAIATARGEGGIGIVRISGPEAVRIASSLFVSSSGQDIRRLGHRVYHGHIRADGRTLDEVLLHVMHAPRSYTREDVVEINCHGGVIPLQAVLESVLMSGARLARPGEFTKRAFLNGRIDLVQAEAVIDRIQAQTEAAYRVAAAAAEGTLSAEVNALRDLLTDALARTEAAVDFPEEDLPELVDDALLESLRDARRRIGALLETARAGRLYREGARAAIVGRPNVGKSSLFNALVRDARAIVTAHAGTTRDVLEEVLNIRGIPVRLSDSAGIRDATDEVEALGVARARDTLRRAEIVLFVLDATAPDTHEDRALCTELELCSLPVVPVLNKADLSPAAVLPAHAVKFGDPVRTSARTGEGVASLEDRIAAALLGGAVQSDPAQALVTRVHQRDSLRRAADSLDRLLQDFTRSPEFLSVDLRDVLGALGEITGETTSEAVLDRIFARFCIGK